MIESFDQALFVKPAEMAHGRRCRDVRPDANAFDRDASALAIGNEQIKQHVPHRFGKKAAREMTRAQPSFAIQCAGGFKQKVIWICATAHWLRQPLATRRRRLSPRVPRLAERSSGPGTSHAPSGRIISKGGRPIWMTSLAGAMSASIST